MFSVTTEASFDSAHFLKGYDGKCANLHGHRWRICVSAKAEKIGDDGMVIDFTDLKRDLKNLADNLDHSLIVEEGSLKEKTVEALREENFRMVFLPFRPTAENFAKYVYDELKKNCTEIYRVRYMKPLVIMQIMRRDL